MRVSKLPILGCWVWLCAQCASGSIAWGQSNQPAPRPTKRPTTTKPTKQTETTSAKALRKIDQTLHELKRMRQQITRKERELRSLQQQLKQGTQPTQTTTKTTGTAPRHKADKPKERPITKRAEGIPKSELDALRDAFRKAPKKRGSGSPTRPPDRRLPGAQPKSELGALRDAFRKAPTQDTQDTQDAPATPTPRPAQTQRGSFAQQLANVMNPAISALGVFAAGWTNGGNGHCHADGACFGQVGVFGHTHDPIRTGFNLQQVEVTLEATVDAYFHAAVVLSFGEGEGVGELEIEEAYMETTSLPWGFQVKGGKFLSDLTRLGSKHLHDLDFVTIALPLLQGAGGELFHYALQVTWLAPLPFYLRLGAEISYGGSILYPIQDPSIPVVVGHLRAFFDLSDSTRLLIGGGVSHGIWDRAEATAADLSRTVATGHLLFQWQPPSRARNLSLKLMLEYYANASQCDPRKTDTKRPQQRQYCVGTDPTQVTTQWLHGLTSKAILQFAQRWQTGVRFDWMQQREPSSLRPTHRLTAMLLFVATEFSRIRLEYNIANPFDNNDLGHAIWLQYQFSIGAHGAHKF